MNRQKRTNKKAASSTTKRRVRSRTATRGRAAASRNRRALAKKRGAPQKTAQLRDARVFEEQIQDVWSRFAHECLQFAEGFNHEIGTHQLHVECNPDSVVAKLAMGGEVLVQLDRDQRRVGCFITSQCGDFGSCVVEQPPIGLTVEDDRLRWVYGATAMSDDDLAVKLMTELVELDANPQSAASR